MFVNQLAKCSLILCVSRLRTVEPAKRSILGHSGLVADTHDGQPRHMVS